MNLFSLTVVYGLLVTLVRTLPSQPPPCDFDNDTCGYVDVGANFTWTFNAGGTLSIGTGPTGDHTSGSGEYCLPSIIVRRN